MRHIPVRCEDSIDPQRVILGQYPIGYRRDTIVVPSRRAVGLRIPSEAFLYDLSDPVRLARETADRFPLRATFHRGANCLEGPPDDVGAETSDESLSETMSRSSRAVLWSVL